MRCVIARYPVDLSKADMETSMLFVTAGSGITPVMGIPRTLDRRTPDGSLWADSVPRPGARRTPGRGTESGGGP